MKSTFILITILLPLFCGSYIFAFQGRCNGTNQHPCIVQDTSSNQAKLKCFRSSPMLAHAYRGNTIGLKELWMSGGSAGSQKDWEQIYKTILKITNYKVKKIIDIDLRQESHGYLNNNAVTLTGKFDWINLNKSHKEVLKSEARWLNDLQSLKIAPDVLQPSQFKQKQFISGKKIPIDSIEDEETMVKKIGYQYFRLTITDHQAPSNIEVDQFVELVRHLQPYTWLHIHCRGGKGRTTTFMAMYDMMRNADKVPFEEIIKRQASVPPFYNLFQVQRKNTEFTVFYRKRLEFLMKFYKYSIDYLNDYPGTWSSWLATKDKNHD